MVCQLQAVILLPECSLGASEPLHSAAIRSLSPCEAIKHVTLGPPGRCGDFSGSQVKAVVILVHRFMLILRLLPVFYSRTHLYSYLYSGSYSYSTLAMTFMLDRVT